MTLENDVLSGAPPEQLNAIFPAIKPPVSPEPEPLSSGSTSVAGGVAGGNPTPEESTAMDNPAKKYGPTIIVSRNSQVPHDDVERIDSLARTIDLSGEPNLPDQWRINILSPERFAELASKYKLPNKTQTAVSILGTGQTYINSDYLKSGAEDDKVTQTLRHEAGHFISKSVKESDADREAERLATKGKK